MRENAKGGLIGLVVMGVGMVVLSVLVLAETGEDLVAVKAPLVVSAPQELDLSRLRPVLYDPETKKLYDVEGYRLTPIDMPVESGSKGRYTVTALVWVMQ